MDEGDLELLQKKGAHDSKGVPRKRRKKVLLGLRELFLAARARAIPPWEIDRSSLTELELEAAVGIIAQLEPQVVILDAPVSPRAIPRFSERLLGECARLGAEPQRIVVAPKADRDFPVVGAASILAKVTRDAYVSHLRRRYGDFGWGYPGEKAAREFLRGWWESHRELPPICRRKWATVKAVLEGAAREA